MGRRAGTSWQKHLVLVAVAVTGILSTATPLVVAQGGWEPGDEWRSQHKAGDSVELKINDEMWQKCKVVGNSPQAQSGGIERPDVGECPLNESPGTVSRNARPSEQLFKRVIFERYRDMESGRKVGVTFKTFSLANSFVNRLTRNGLTHDGAPQGVTVYRYKTDFFTCVKYTDSILRTDVKEGYFACFKDKSGEWACAEDGRRSWDQKHLPVK